MSRLLSHLTGSGLAMVETGQASALGEHWAQTHVWVLDKLREGGEIGLRSLEVRLASVRIYDTIACDQWKYTIR
jgi:hypothetical protein